MARWTAEKDVWKDIAKLSYMNKEAPRHKVTDLSAMAERDMYYESARNVPEYPNIGRGRAAISRAAKAKLDAEYDSSREIYEHLRETNPISYSNENIERHFGFKPSPPVEPQQFEDGALHQCEDTTSRNALLKGLAKKREKQISVSKARPVNGFTAKRQYALDSKEDFPALT